MAKHNHEKTDRRLPDEGYLRLWQIIGGKGYAPILPISRSSFLEGVRQGIYPKPVRFGKRMDLWRVKEIREIEGAK